MLLRKREKAIDFESYDKIVLVRKEKAIDCLLIFVVCLLPRLYMALNALPLAYSSDEVSAISIAARLAGYDWNDVVSEAGYYGIGFFWIFAGLFKMRISPVYIYRIILIFLGSINALIGPLYYLIMTNYLNVNNRIMRILIASICGNTIFLYVLDQSIMNENILALLICLTVYLLCRIVYQRKFRDEIFLLLILLYSLTCHTRMIALVLTVLAIGLLYYIFYKKRLFHKSFYIICISGAVVVNRLLSLYRAGIWTGKTVVRNSSVSSGFMKALKTMISVGNPLEVIRTWLKIFIGQIYTATSLTGGIFLIATIICLIFLFRWLIKKEWKLEGQNLTESNVIISLFSLVLIFMIIASMGITWFPSVYNDIQTYGTDVFVSSYRAFTYTRYFGVFVPSLIMVAFSIACNNFYLMKRSSYVSLFVYILLFVIWITEILKYFLTTKRNYFYFLAGFGNNNQVNADWMRACFVGAIFVLFWLTIRKEKQFIFMLVACLLLLVSEQIYTFKYTVQEDETKIYQKGDAGYYLLNNLEGKTGKEIYVCDMSDATNHQIFYIYQFLNYDYHVIPGLPQSSQESFILFTNERVKDMENSGVLWWQLDNNEYVYTNIDEYQDAISKYLENNIV